MLFECEEYHSLFQSLEATHYTLLSDKMGFYFSELQKLPEHVSEGDVLLLWLSLFKAETEEELEKIKEMEVSVMSLAINAYYTITTSSEFRGKERLRAKARHDEAQALYNAERNAKIGIAQNMIADGEPVKNYKIHYERKHREFESLTESDHEESEYLRLWGIRFCEDKVKKLPPRKVKNENIMRY